MFEQLAAITKSVLTDPEVVCEKCTKEGTMCRACKRMVGEWRNHEDGDE